MSDYLPDELLTKILFLLPTKSLVRATCVCKSWHSLITSSDFITNHLSQTMATNDSNNNHLIFLRHYPGYPGKERHALHFDNDTFDRYDDVEFPFKSCGLNQYFRVLGSCNGLICLSDDYLSLNNTFVLWNPSIRKSLTLPLPKFTYRTYGPFEHAIGFGFDSRSNDYKVVRIVYLQDEDYYSPRVELYRLSTRSWENITATADPWCHLETITATADPLCNLCYLFPTHALLNGAVHWSACRDVSKKIISFDMSDEVFREIRLPASYLDKDSFDSMTKVPLAVCGQWLSFFDYQWDYNNKRCSIWVMKEYGVVDSWTELYTIDLNGGLGKTLGFRRNGEILLVMTFGELVSYDPKNQQIKPLGIHDSGKALRPSDVNSYSFHVDAYVKSLILIGDGKSFGRAGVCDAREEKEENACDES